MEEFLHLLLDIHGKITIASFHSFLVAGVLVVVTLLAWKIIPPILDKALSVTKNTRARELANKISSITILWLGALAVLSTLGVGAALATFSSVIILSLSFALQQVLQGIVAGFYIMAESDFNEGDYIRFSGFEGIVKEVRIRVLVVEDARTGVDTYIPNLNIFTGIVENFHDKPPAPPPPSAGR